jgi:predicted Rossmann-fold nucleotide-binding protein
MRLIFGVVSLLIVMAIVYKLQKTQLQALGIAGDTATRAAAQPGDEARAVTNAVMGRAGDRGAAVAVPGGMPGAMPAPMEGTVPYQAQSIQNNVRNATNAALQQGAERNAAAAP